MAHLISKSFDRVLSDAGREWHGLAEVMPEGTTPGRFAEVAGWSGVSGLTYAKEEVFTADGRAVPGTHAVVCARSEGSRVIGSVGDGYVHTQPSDMIELCEVFGKAGAAGSQITVTSGGTVDEGRELFLTVRVNDQLLVNGKDVVKPFLCLTSNQVGRRGYRIGWCGTRMVCMNTVRAALSQMSGADHVNLRHTSGWRRRLNEVKEVLGFASHAFDDMRLQMDALIGFGIGKNDPSSAFVGELYDQLCPYPHRPNTLETKAVAKWEKQMADTKELRKSWLATAVRESNELGQPLNAWLVVNGYTKWRQHDARMPSAKADPNVRTARALWGNSGDDSHAAQLKALQLIGAGALAGV